MVEDVTDEGFPIYPPPDLCPLVADLCNDPRIVKVLAESGKMIP